METLRLTGKPVADFLKEEIKKRVNNLNSRDIVPALRLIRVGEREDDIFYEKSILKNCKNLGIEGTVCKLPANVGMEELEEAIVRANKDKDVHGIMLFRPLPEHLDLDIASCIIDPNKDVDCMSPVNLEKIFTGRNLVFAPCTPKAVVEMLKYYNVPLSGYDVVVAGRSLVVGKPLVMLLLNENATVTVCHSKTMDMKKITKKANIVVAAVGKAKFMNREYFNHSSVVIDVGINDDGSGKICGDVNYEDVFGKVKAISPAVGGVGAITTSILMRHVVTACEMLINKESKSGCVS